MSVSGDPAKVAEGITAKALSDMKSKLDEALSAAMKLLESSYARAVDQVRAEVQRKAEELSELLRSKAAEADLQVKLREESIKAEETEKVMNEALARISKDKGEWYVKFLRRVLEALQEEGEAYGGFVVRCSAEDRELLKELIKGYRGLELSDEPVPVMGGVIATSKDGSVRLDYSIGQLVKENETYLRGLASRTLFEVS